MTDLGLLALRVPMGALLAGHGAQKLFGWFDGPGLAGTAGYLESLGLRPGGRWALPAALAEFGGGTLTALGLLNPVGPMGIMSAMTMAALTAHRGKPIWVTAGGAELPLTNVAAAAALALAGPGRYSLDGVLNLRIPRLLASGVALAAAAGIVAGLVTRARATRAKVATGEQGMASAAS